MILIVSGIILIFILLMVTFSLFGISDMGIVTALAFGFMTPTLIVTFFFDTAAIFEDRRIFDSIQRSIRLVFAHVNAVIAFLLMYLGIFIGIVIALTFVWEAFLFDKLEPISRYNETQLQIIQPGSAHRDDWTDGNVDHGSNSLYRDLPASSDPLLLQSLFL